MLLKLERILTPGPARVWKLSSTLEEDQKNTESLQRALDSIKKERDEIVELAESIGSASSDLALHPSTAIGQLAEENVALQREAESVRAKFKKLLSEEKARMEYTKEAIRTEYESTLQNLGEKLREIEVEHRRRVEELLESQEQYQEKVKLKDELLLLKHEVDQYANTQGSQRLECDQELENIERSLEVRHAAEMEALKSEHRANIEVLRDRLQQKRQDAKADYEEEQQKLRRSLETKPKLVANSQNSLGWCWRP
ncbi:hypothetical protein HPB51_012690 [Rhipicephalus microplus]|uniref:Uncharacterized protein n=1 Tax=Rhipicephalus microplus TaxID=6941 RepID=A0A9J6D563_RHIMP|nr:hypothetical protein HPB51_012690 [Rhipicephalus microplus]